MSQFPLCPQCGAPYCPECGTRRNSGTLQGPTCNPVPVHPHPTAYYLVPENKWPAQVAADFGQYKNGRGDYGPLVGANVGFWVAGFSQNTYGECVMNGWKAGILIRVPVAWLNIPVHQIDSLPARVQLFHADGRTPWTPSPVTVSAGGFAPAVSALHASLSARPILPV
jgi:hypothetical protein